MCRVCGFNMEQVARSTAFELKLSTEAARSTLMDRRDTVDQCVRSPPCLATQLLARVRSFG